MARTVVALTVFCFYLTFPACILAETNDNMNHDLVFGGEPSVMTDSLRNRPIGESQDPRELESDMPSYLTLALVLNWYRHDGLLKPYPHCCEFSGYEDYRPSFFVMYSLADIQSGIGAFIKVLYMNASARFVTTTRAESWVVEMDDQGRPVERTAMITQERTVNADLHYISVVPGLRWEIPSSSAFLTAGATFSVPMKTKYSMDATLLEPVGYVYLGSGTIHEVLVTDADIPESKKTMYGLDFTVGLDIRMSRKAFFTPQIGLLSHLSPVSQTFPEWKFFTVYGSIGLTYDL